MIITLTPNPALDRTLVIPSLQPGEVHRATQTIVAAGGKGLNVARALKCLGSEPLAMGLLGGYSGRLLADLTAAEDIPTAWTWTNIETRTCVIIAPENQDATAINDPGPTITAAAWKKLVTDVVTWTDQAEVVCLCGSLPPGCPDEAPLDLVTAVKQTGRPVWVDTSGPALKQAIQARPDGIKINFSEAVELLGQTLPAMTSNDGVAWAGKAIRQLHQAGIPHVVLTLGKQGALQANADGVWWGQAPPIEVVSSVGSGDAFFAGLVYEISQHNQAEDALSSAIAAGSANAMTLGGGAFSQTIYTALRKEIKIARLS